MEYLPHHQSRYSPYVHPHGQFRHHISSVEYPPPITQHQVHEPVTQNIHLTVENLRSTFLDYCSKLYDEYPYQTAKLEPPQSRFPNDYSQYEDILRNPLPYTSNMNYPPLSKDYHYEPIVKQKFPHPKRNWHEKAYKEACKIPSETRFVDLEDPLPSIPANIKSFEREVLQNAKEASKKLLQIEDFLYSETDNPLKRTFAYTSVPEYRRVPYLGNQNQLKQFLLQLYTDLYTLHQFNKCKIEVISNRIRLLRLNQNTYASQNPFDPRIAL